MQLEGQYGPGIEEPKKKRKAKARQKSPKVSHASSDMSLKSVDASLAKLGHWQARVTQVRRTNAT